MEHSPDHRVARSMVARDPDTSLGAPAVPAVADAPGSRGPRPRRPWRPARPRRVVLGTLLIGLLVALAAVLVVVRSDHSFSGQIDRSQCLGGRSCSIPSETPALRSFPAGLPVRLSWSSPDGLFVGFYVLDPQGDLVPGTNEDGVNGTCSFVAEPGSYEVNFEVLPGNWTTAVVDFSGRYEAPLF